MDILSMKFSRPEYWSGYFSLLQGMFPIQGLNPGLPHCGKILYQLSHQESPRILEWVDYPFSSGSSRPRNWTRVSCFAGEFFTNQLNYQGSPLTWCAVKPISWHWIVLKKKKSVYWRPSKEKRQLMFRRLPDGFYGRSFEGKFRGVDRRLPYQHNALIGWW